MPWYIDETETRLDRRSDGGVVVYYRCGCALCDKCWFRPDIGICFCGGPYSGVETDKCTDQTSDHAKQ